MKNLLRTSFLFFALLLTGSAFSQVPDTVLVYEYVHVTDTVWIEPTVVRDTTILEKLKPIMDATLIIDSVTNDAKLLIYFEEKTATIPINRIILSKNNYQNLKSMKKVTFLGLTFLAVNASLFAQRPPEKSMGIYLKESMRFQTARSTGFEDAGNSLINHYEAKYSFFDPGIGINVNYPISSFVSFMPRICFAQLSGSYYINDAENPDSRTWIYGKIFNYLSTDILLNYYLLKSDKTFVRFYGGPKIDCIINQKKGIDLTNSAYENFNYTGLSFLAGIGVDMGKRFYVELEYSRNLSNAVDDENTRVNIEAVSMNIGWHLFKP